MSRISNLIKKAQSYKGQEFKQGRMFVPSGMIVPETAKNAMARQLYQAGIISRDDFDKMLGVVYDIDDIAQERFDDEAFSALHEEFELSKLSEYYDDYDRDEEPASDSKRTENVQPNNVEQAVADVQQSDAAESKE